MYQKIFLQPDSPPPDRLVRPFRRVGMVLALAMLPSAALLAAVEGAPWAGATLLLCALSLALVAREPLRPLARRAALALAAAALAAAGAALAAPGQAAPLPWLVSPLPALALLALCCALLAGGRLIALAQGGGLLVLYLAGAQLIWATQLHPAPGSAAAMLTATSGLAFGAAACLCVRAGQGLLATLAQPGSAGVLERRLLPLAAVLPLLMGWLRGLAVDSAGGFNLALESFGALVLAGAMLALLRYTGQVLTASEARVSGERDRLRRLLLAHGHGLLLVERSGRIALANPAMARLIGGTLADLHEGNVADVLPEIIPELERHFGQAAAGSPGFEPIGPARQCLARHRQGQGVAVEVSLTPVLVDDRDYLLGTVVDIRERQRVEQLQKTLEAQLKLFIRHAPVAIAMLDHELRYIAASERWMQDFGLGHQPLVGRRHFEVFPQLPVAEQERLGHALLGQVDRRESMRFLRGDGGVDWFRSEIRPWRDDRHQIGGVLMFAERITEQIAAQAALQRMRKETERLLRGQVDELQALNSEIVRTAQSGLLVFRASGACLLANEAAARMVGSTVERLLSEDFRAIESWQRHGLLDAALAALDSGDTTECEVDYPRPGQPTLQLAFSFSSVAAGSARYLVVNAQDISSYIATQRELRSAGEAARQANDAKSMFIANMSHEIRTPMNAVLGLAYLLEGDASLGPDARETAGKIRQAGRALMGIVDDILDLSKIEAGQLELERIPFRLSEVFSRVGTMLAGAGRGLDNELILREPPDDADALVGDPLRLEQVLLNLAGNALKFTQAGEVEIAAEVLSRGPGEVVLRLSVRDTGIGIAPAQQEQIFLPFSQADSSTARRFGGTGLGLTICQKIVTAMGGTMGVQSVPGAGSTFWCELRLPRDRATGGGAPLPPQRGRALVVEARAATRAALCAQLDRLGWQSAAVASGEAALARAAQREGVGYQLVLVDSRLDEAMAHRLVPALRALPGLAAACTVLMVEPMGSGDGRPPAQAAADGALSKPVDSQRLAATLARAARRHGPLPAPPCAPDRRAAPTAPAAVPPTLDGMRVLVVDDSATNLEVASRILERFGARVDAAESGSAALQLLRDAPQGFDAVLMDIQMPDLDGLEATRRLRRDLGLAALPVIALSGGAMADQVEKARAAGMNDFLTKPFETQALVAMLQRWVGDARRGPAG